MKKIKIVEVKSEIGAGTRGASMGPDAIKIAALDYGSNLFKKIDSIEVQTENNLLFESPGSPYAKRIKGMYTVLERTANAVRNTFSEIGTLLPNNDKMPNAKAISVAIGIPAPDCVAVP